MRSASATTAPRAPADGIRFYEDRGEPCEVSCDPAGVPRELLLGGRVHRVVSPPQRWYQRIPWWELERGAPREIGYSVVDRQHWCVQAVQCGAMELRTLELVHHGVTGQWWLLPDAGKGVP